MDTIRNIELFSKLDDDEFEKLNKHLEHNEMKSGQFLFHKNQSRHSLHIVQSGVVELVAGENIHEDIITSFFSGDFIGEGALLESYPHSTSAIAIEDSLIVTLDKTKFDKFLETEPKIGSKILAAISKVISRRLRMMTTKMFGSASQYLSGRVRLEHDLLGEKPVPFDAYYGVQTLRAQENFPITGVQISHYTDMIISLAQIKQSASRTNNELGGLDDKIAKAIDDACEQIIHHKYHNHFVVDIMQGGAGTSTNMNANEVIANRALEIMGYRKGQYEYCHPNNHVNLSQSTNDIYPNAIKLATYYKYLKLYKEVEELSKSFNKKSKEFKDIIKMGRTQLQDAVPMTLGQEFKTYADTLKEELHKLKYNSKFLLEMNLGGTAIGTGLNADERYPELASKHLSDITGFNISIAANLVEATQDTGVFVLFSSITKRLAIKLSKICNDLRLLSSGPRAGLNEINLPAVQPGSSIMPGKVNPVIPEVVNQVCYNVIGKDLTITMAAEAGQLQLNVMEPVIATSLFELIDSLKNAVKTLRLKCVNGITANEEVTRAHVMNSIGLVTALNPHIGYENCTMVAKEALDKNKSVYDIVLEKGLLSQEKLDEVLDPESMI